MVPEPNRKTWTRPKKAPSRRQSLDALDADTLRRLKRKGFSDRRLAALLGVDQGAVRNKAGPPASARCTSAWTPAPPNSPPAPPICTRPTRKSARRNRPAARKNHGAGRRPNRIGQGIEFDYCCVHAALACANPALRPSWSTATRKPCPDRLRHLRPPVLRAADAGRRAGKSSKKPSA